MEKKGNNKKEKVLVYGVMGFTGNLFLEYAFDKNMPIILGAREDSIRQKSSDYGKECRIFAIDDTQSIIPHLADVKAVVNLANISYRVNRHLIDACIETNTHYVDLAAEYPDMIEVYNLNDAALANGVMLMPGAGFNLAPSDIAGLIASELLPNPTKLTLGFATFGKASRGTINTVLRLAAETGHSRLSGKLVATSPASAKHSFFAEGKEYVMVHNPIMGDAIASFVSTNIPDITSYAYYPWILVQFMKGRLDWLRKFLINHTHWFFPFGPTKNELKTQHSYTWAEVENKRGDKLIVTIRGPQPYIFTVRIIGNIIQRLVDGNIKEGFIPPSFYGRKLIESIDGVQISVANKIRP